MAKLVNEFKTRRCGNPDTMEHEKMICCDRWRLPEKCQKEEVKPKELLNIQEFEEENTYKGSCELPDTIDIYGNLFI